MVRWKTSQKLRTILGHFIFHRASLTHSHTHFPSHLRPISPSHLAPPSHDGCRISLPQLTTAAHGIFSTLLPALLRPNTTMTSLAEVVEKPDDTGTWKGMAGRLLHMCGFWSRGLPPHEECKFFDNMEVAGFHGHHERLVSKLYLNVDVCDPASR